MKNIFICSLNTSGNVLKNSDDVIVTVICDKYQERLDAASAKIVGHGYPVPMQTTDYKDVMKAKSYIESIASQIEAL